MFVSHKAPVDGLNYFVVFVHEQCGHCNDLVTSVDFKQAALGSPHCVYLCNVAHNPTMQREFGIRTVPQAFLVGGSDSVPVADSNLSGKDLLAFLAG